MYAHAGHHGERRAVATTKKSFFQRKKLFASQINGPSFLPCGVTVRSIKMEPGPRMRMRLRMNLCVLSEAPNELVTNITLRTIIPSCLSLPLPLTLTPFLLSHSLILISSAVFISITKDEVRRKSARMVGRGEERRGERRPQAIQPSPSPSHSGWHRRVRG